MANTIFDRPDLSVFTRLDDLGLEVTGQRVEADHGSVGVPYYWCGPVVSTLRVPGHLS